MDFSALCTNCFKLKGHSTVCPYCGQIGAPAPSEAYHLPPETILNGRYLLGRVLGFGGFGVIYLALDLKLSSVVAIKEFFPTSLMCRVPGELSVSIYSGDKYDEYRKGIERFLEEARNMASFAKNPYIVNVFDFFTENRTAYIVMEYLDGISLDRHIKDSGGRLPIDESLSVVRHILKGLSILHGKNILHRDINPKNIMLTSDGKIKIIDFGTAKFAAESELTRTNVVTGGYSPPEQYQIKSQQNAFTDIYSVGATLYRMLTGTIPADAPDRQVKDTVKRPSETVSGIPDNVDIAVMKAMAMKPVQRFQSAEEMIDALTDSNADIEYPDVEEHKKIVKRNIIVISSLIAAVVVFACVIFFTQKYDPLFSPMRSSIEKSETISMYIPYAEADDKHDIYVKYKNVADDFTQHSKKQYGRDINVEIITVPEEDYKKTVAEKAETSEAPCLFRSDMAEGVDIKKANLDKMIEYFTEEDSLLFMNEYKEFFGSDYDSFPLGFYVYVMYVNSKDRAQILNRWDELREKKSYLLISHEAVPALYLSLKDDNASLDTASDVFWSTIDDKTGKLFSNSGALDAFLDKKSIYYAGTTNEIGKIYNQRLTYNCTAEKMTGSDEWYGRFDDIWSVSADVSESKTCASVLFLRYCLEYNAQDKIYYAPESCLPLNRKYCEEQLNAKSILKDSIADSLDEIIITDSGDEADSFADEYIKETENKVNTEESIKSFAKKYFE